MDTAAGQKMVYPSKCLMKLIHGIGLEGREKLKNFEFYPNWLCLPKEVTLHPTELEGIVSYLKNFANEMLPRDDSEKQLRTFGLAPIICNNVLTYMMILQSDYTLADDCLTESNRLIGICLNSPEIIAKDYLKGMFYIVKGLKILLESHTKMMGDFNFNDFIIQAVENFEDLPLKGRVAVLMSKLLFLKLFAKCESGLNIDEIVYLDPDYFEWRIYQYLDAKNKRCGTRGGGTSVPDEKEIQAVQYAWNLAPYNPFCIAYLCLCLTDLLSNQPGRDSSPQQPWNIVFGQWQFSGEEEVATFIREACVKILKANPQSVKINLIVADIMGYLIPFKFRDRFLARECIYQAYRFGEKVSSAANHRLAIYMLQTQKFPMTDPTLLTENLLERAYYLNKRNTDALYTLIQVQLENPKKFYTKIRMLFATHLCNYDLTDEFIQKLIFLKGCFHIMVGENEDAILTWLSVYSSYESKIDFMSLRSYSYVFRVLKWSYQFLNLPYIIASTNDFFTALCSTLNNQRVSSAHTNSLKQTKNLLMEMMQDQYQALNSDTHYQLMMSKSRHVNCSDSSRTPIPYHHRLPVPPRQDDELSDGLESITGDASDLGSEVLDNLAALFDQSFPLEK